MIKKIFYNCTIFLLILFFFELFARVLNLAPVLGTSKNLLDTSTIPYKNNSNIEGNSFWKKCVYRFKWVSHTQKKIFLIKMINKIYLFLETVSHFASGVLEEESFIGLLRKKMRILIY